MQYFRQPLDEVVDVVARALLAELAEVGQVLADLGGADAQPRGQLVGRGGETIGVGLQAGKFAEIERQAADYNVGD